MIIIVSQEDEPTTDVVIRWIKSMNTPFVRINDSDVI